MADRLTGVSRLRPWRDDRMASRARAARSRLGFSYVTVHDPAEVTSLDGSAEVPASEGGLSRADVDEIWASAVKLYRTGLHPAVAVTVRRHGVVVLDRAIGHTHGVAPTEPPGTPLVRATPRSPFNAFSASKAVTAMMIHLLDERGLLHLDDPVAEYAPEFARHGKKWITLRHVLTHRAGIPAIPTTHVDVALLTDQARIFELLCDTRPASLAGRRLAYHALTGGYVLAEVVRRVTGGDVRQLLEASVLRPLGFERLTYGVPPADVGKVAVNMFTGPPALPPYSWLLERSLGTSVRAAAELSNDPRFLTAIVPSGNIIGTSNELCRFFELLRQEGELDGVRVLDERTVRRAVAEQSYLEMDWILAMPIRYGMGFMLGGRYLSLYGHDTERAFGHLGFTNVMAWADPERALSAAIVTNGKPFLTPGQLTFLNVARTISRVTPKVSGHAGA